MRPGNPRIVKYPMEVLDFEEISSLSNDSVLQGMDGRDVES